METSHLELPRASPTKEFPSKMDLDLQHRSTEEIRAAIWQLRARSQMVKEETLLLSTHLIRVFDMRMSTANKIVSGSVVERSGIEGIALAAKEIARRHFEVVRKKNKVKDIAASASLKALLSFFTLGKLRPSNRLGSGDEGKQPLTDAQKSPIVELELRHYQIHLQRVEQEMLRFSDGIKGKTDELDEFVKFVAREESDFRRKILKTGIKTNKEISSERLLLWLRAATTQMDNMIQVAKLSRKKKHDEIHLLNSMLQSPVEDMGTIDFMALETDCKTTDVTLRKQIQLLKRTEYVWNKISRRRNVLKDELSKTYKSLVFMDEKIRHSRNMIDELKSKVMVVNGERKDMADTTLVLRQNMTVKVYPTRESYIVILQEVEDLQREKSLWDNKIQILLNLQRVRESTVRHSHGSVPSGQHYPGTEGTCLRTFPRFMPMDRYSQSMFCHLRPPGPRSSRVH